jgi:hypothetical protein
MAGGPAASELQHPLVTLVCMVVSERRSADRRSSATPRRQDEAMHSRPDHDAAHAAVPDGIGAVFGRLQQADPGCEDRDTVVGYLDDCRRLKAFTDAIELRCTRRLRDLAADGRSESPETALSATGRKSRREAAKARGREQVTESMPGFGDALANGTIAAGHLDAVADATRNLDDTVRQQFTEHHDDLLTAAASRGVDDFERECRELARFLAARHDADAGIDDMDRMRKLSRIRRTTDTSSGMKRTTIELDPIRDEQLHRVLRAHLRACRTPNSGQAFHELEIDALMSMVTAAATDGASPGCHATPRITPVPEIGVLVSLEWLLGQMAEHGMCETYDGVAVPISTVRRWCCDAEVIPYVLGADGAVTDMGRSTRTVTRDQRRRLRAMHRACAFPGCGTSFEDCRIHHVRFWKRDHGPTDIENLLPLCQRHHTMVHEGRWTLEMTPDRIATWTRPDGIVHHTGTTIDRATGLATTVAGTPDQATTGRDPPECAA